MASRRPLTEPRRGQKKAQSNLDDASLNNWYETLGLSREAKKNNPERAREASRDASAKATRTVHTYPRATNGNPRQRKALQDVRQQLLFSDEGSGIEELNDTPGCNQHREMSSAASDAQSSDSGVAENGQSTDSNQIVGRLMQIRDYLKQATVMRDTLNKDSPNSQEQLGKLSRLVLHLREQEEGYMGLLQKMLADRSPGSEVLNNGQLDKSGNDEDTRDDVNDDGDDEDNDSEMSLGVEDARSEVSECTTDQTWNACSRPNIESQMGVYSDMSSVPSSARGSGGNETTTIVVDEPLNNLSGTCESSLLHTLTNRDLVHNVLDNQEEETIDMLTQSDISETVQDKETEVKALREQRDLLKKMLDQQRMLKSLHEKQAHLLRIKKEAESNLTAQEQQQPQDQSDDDNPVEEEDDADVNDQEDEESTLNSFASGYDEPTVVQSIVPPELHALRQRLQYLNNVFDSSMAAQAEDVQKLEVLRQMAAAETSQAVEGVPAITDDNQSECSSPERQELKNKLADLQEKKARMDQLLSELQSIRVIRKENADESSGAESSVTGQVLRETKEKAQSAGATAGQAETVLDVMEQESKLRKLKEVRDKLDQLRGLVQYYQAGQEFIQNNEETADEDEISESGQDMSLLGNLSKVSLDNLMREKSITTTEQSEQSDIDSSFSLGDTADDPEIQEKMRKLQEAKDKLARLQSLVAMVYQDPGVPVMLPDELAELASGVDNSDIRSSSSVASSSQARFADRWNQLNQAQDSESESHKEDAQAQEEDFYRAKMEEQREELNRLKDERERLVLIQEELMNLHMKQPQVSAEKQKQSSRPKKMNPDAARGVKFVPEVKDPATGTDDLWERMRTQRMQREENKQGWPEEDQMTADVTTMATWGESDSSSSSSSDDEATPRQQELEEDDGYPSDGILQVEEEEEGKASEADTYTVENEYKHRQRYPADGQKYNKRKVRLAQKSKPDSAPVHPGAGDHWLPGNNIYYHGWPKFPSDGRRADAVDRDLISTMKEQLDATTEMCHYLLGQQRITDEKLSTIGGSDEPWQQHRFLYSINQLYSQVADLQAAMKVTVEQVYAISHHLDDEDHEKGPLSAGDFRPYDPALRTPSPFGYPSWAAASVESAKPRSQNRQEPGYKNYAPCYTLGSQGAGGETSDQSTIQDESMARNKQNIKKAEELAQSLLKSRPKEGQRTITEAEHNYSVPPLDLDKLIKRREAQRKAMNSQKTSGRSYPSPSLSAIAAGRVKLPDYKPGVSAGICGTTFADTASMSSALSSVRSSRDSKNVTPVTTPGKGRQQQVKTVELSRQMSEGDSDLSLFEALRETIYSEVATLISQNENRPHFLIELFRELQMLSSDYLRQRALYSVQELVTKFLTEDVAALSSALQSEESGSIGAPQPAWMLYAASESGQTPSESCVTTDEEEVKMMLEQQHPITPVASSAKLTASQKNGSLQGQTVDYLENVESTSTLSTSPSVSGAAGAWDNPFNNDSLGDTVIHLDKVKGTCWFDRLPDGELVNPIEELHGSSGSVKKTHSIAGSDTVSEVSMPFACNSPLQDTAIDLSEAMQKVREYENRVGKEPSSATSSSAQDQGSDDEGSTDIQMTRIDTQELDRQIKTIMTEIIPVLREHMDNICSAQLLSYLQERVLQLTIQPDQQTEEFAHYFQRQLGNILRDSLSKFEGRKMRDCGEEILVDISETLFNELAFFRLMQDLDDPEVKGRLAQNKWRNGETSTEASTTGADDTTNAEDGGDEDEEDAQSESKQEEEEDLGKDRDDAFAQETNTSEVHYELAPSETKPMTRIGSDEDCTDDDSSTSVSTDTADDTAVSRQAAQEDDNVQHANSTDDKDITIDDLPLKLDVNKEEIAAQATCEQDTLRLSAINISLTGDELVGNSTELKEPPITELVEETTEDSEKKNGTPEKDINTAEECSLADISNHTDDMGD